MTTLIIVLLLTASNAYAGSTEAGIALLDTGKTGIQVYVIDRNYCDSLIKDKGIYYCYKFVKPPAPTVSIDLYSSPNGNYWTKESPAHRGMTR